MIDCVLIRWNDYPTNTNYTVLNWDVKLLSPVVVGLDEDLEYLVKTEPFAKPSFDTRLFNLVTTQEFVDEESAHAPLKKWSITYDTADRTNDDKKVSVDESESDANYGVFPTNKQLKYIALTLAILDKKASGLTVSAKEQEILDKVNTKALKIWNNHINAQAKKVDIDEGNPIDLDDGFDNVDPDEATT